MTSSRVKSKNLFNFRPQGFIDEDIAAFYEKIKSTTGVDRESLTKKMKTQTEEEFAGGIRTMIEKSFTTNSFGTDAAYVEVCV